MAAINSIRAFHSELAMLCCSLESLFDLANSDHETLCLAVRPAMERFRELLDLGDRIAGPEPGREVVKH